MSSKLASNEFIRQIPKAELHVHLEGTIEPEMIFNIASRNKIRLPYRHIEEVKKAYDFRDLRDFLTLYNEGTRILRHSIDFYDITLAYLAKCHEQRVLHTEIFLDFQTYLKRGMPAEVQLEGIERAQNEAFQRWGISSKLIVCFLRHLGPEAAMHTFDEVKKHKDRIVGVGLASTENGYPPELFAEVFREAKKAGFKTVAHAGEEGPWEYVRDSIRYLNIDRIDHGNRSCQNPELVKEITEKQIPLTLCPLSNIKLKNVDRIENHTIKKMLDLGMKVTINSDDPAYFGGYINKNMELVADTFELSENEMVTLAKNSFEASFISEKRRDELLAELDNFLITGK